MSGHLLITGAIMLAIAGPAFADCDQEIQSLDEAVTRAETGASTDAALLRPRTRRKRSLAVSRAAGLLAQATLVRRRPPHRPISNRC